MFSTASAPVCFETSVRVCGLDSKMHKNGSPKKKKKLKRTHSQQQLTF